MIPAIHRLGRLIRRDLLQLLDDAFKDYAPAYKAIRRALLLLSAAAVWRVGDVAGWICTKAYRRAGRMRARALFPGRTI